MQENSFCDGQEGSAGKKFLSIDSLRVDTCPGGSGNSSDWGLEGEIELEDQGWVSGSLLEWHGPGQQRLLLCPSGDRTQEGVPRDCAGGTPTPTVPGRTTGGSSFICLCTVCLSSSYHLFVFL